MLAASPLQAVAAPNGVAAMRLVVHLPACHAAPPCSPAACRCAMAANISSASPCSLRLSPAKLWVLQAEVLGEIEDRLVGYLQKGTGACTMRAVAVVGWKREGCRTVSTPAGLLAYVPNAACRSLLSSSNHPADTEAEVLSSVAAVLLRPAVPNPPVVCTQHSVLCAHPLQTPRRRC